MLSNLASYLGYAAASGSDSSTAQEAATAETQMRLRAVEDDDWVLVERGESGTTGEDEPWTRPARHLPSVGAGGNGEDEPWTRPARHLSAAGAGGSGEDEPWTRPARHLSSVATGGSAPLQESWYLTPPPSFSSDGPVHMETSPLENLLIEHPSMSVYQRRNDTNSTASDEDSPRTLLPRKEKLNKLPRNKLNAKYSKKRPPTSSSDEAASLHSASEDEKKKKEPKMRNFVKSPRRSINAELKSFTRKTSRRRAEASSSDEMKSIPSTNEDEIVIPQIRKKLYSEVLATKPPVRSQPELPKPTEVPEAETKETPSETAPAMAVEEAPAPEPAPEPAPTIVPDAEREVSTVMVRDRRTVQTVADHQTRLHFLNRSAQKTEQRKTCDVMKRNPMGRTNKARELNSRNKRQRRADMQQRHSGANNNRKC